MAESRFGPEITSSIDRAYPTDYSSPVHVLDVTVNFGTVSVSLQLKAATEVEKSVLGHFRSVTGRKSRGINIFLRAFLLVGPTPS
jgi:hypothetical protein